MKTLWATKRAERTDNSNERWDRERRRRRTRSRWTSKTNQEEKEEERKRFASLEPVRNKFRELKKKTKLMMIMMREMKKMVDWDDENVNRTADQFDDHSSFPIERGEEENGGLQTAMRGRWKLQLNRLNRFVKGFLQSTQNKRILNKCLFNFTRKITLKCYFVKFCVKKRNQTEKTDWNEREHQRAIRNILGQINQWKLTDLTKTWVKTYWRYNWLKK